MLKSTRRLIIATASVSWRRAAGSLWIYAGQWRQSKLLTQRTSEASLNARCCRARCCRASRQDHLQPWPIRRRPRLGIMYHSLATDSKFLGVPSVDYRDLLSGLETRAHTTSGNLGSSTSSSAVLSSSAEMPYRNAAAASTFPCASTRTSAPGSSLASCNRNPSGV